MSNAPKDFNFKPGDADHIGEAVRKPPGLSVGQLRKLLEGVPDDLNITVRGLGEDDDDFCGGILGGQIEHAHDEDDTPFFALDCSSDEADFDEDEEE